jgi:diguanylate cyclase (GGDEF)-like protein
MNQAAAQTDELTRLANRRALNLYLTDLVQKKNRRDCTMLLLVDMDNLKKINDTYGHEMGDAAIQSVAQCLKDLESDGCRAFRMGGEEFVVLLNAPSPALGLRKAEELQHKLSVFKIPSGSLTVSIGIAFLGPNGSSVRELLGYADEAMYRAKASGKNRIEVARLDS